MAEVLVPKETLAALETQRVVISGGEPLLHPEINEILGYYHDLVDDVVVITNGYGLDSEEVGPARARPEFRE